MSTIQRNLILYDGISTCQIDNLPYFNQLNIDYKFCIPKQKPDIEQLIKVWVETDVIDTEVIKTPVGTSMEGQYLTGYKLLVCADMKLKVEYETCDKTQSVHTAHATIPFCGCVSLPENTNLNTIITATISVEDISSEKLNCRCAYNNITMMLIANIC